MQNNFNSGYCGRLVHYGHCVMDIRTSAYLCLSLYFFPITAQGLMVGCASLCLCLYLSDYSLRADGGFVSLCLYKFFFFVFVFV